MKAAKPIAILQDEAKNQNDMKKCDLHIHTTSTVSDSTFTFSLEVLKDYVLRMGIDVIAITNHNVFNMADYIAIRGALEPIVVLPGIEVDLEGGHILVISNSDDAELYDFTGKCSMVSSINDTSTSTMSLADFRNIFTDLNKYLLIPHYDKTPSLPKPAIEAMKDYILAGEVTSVKKFIYMQKSVNERLTPVLFSDSRFKEGMTVSQYPTRQTFLDINDVTVNAIKTCLRDKSNATLTEQDGNKLFTIFSNGQRLSTGLNIMYGRRSTGKTWTLDHIAEIFGDGAKYIRQFELQNYGRPYSSEQFENEQKVRLESEVSAFLRPFKNVVDDIILLPDARTDDSEVENYLSVLIKRSNQENVNDVYSNSKLYDEIDYPVGTTSKLRSLIDAVILLIENAQYRDIIDAHLEIGSLKALLKDLIDKLRSKEAFIRNKSLTNGILHDVKNGLQIQAALPVVPDIDLYGMAIRSIKRKKFHRIVNDLKREKIIYSESMLHFKVSVHTKTFTNATEVKEGLSISASLVPSFRKYNEPLDYLRSLIDLGIDSSKLHRMFVGVKYAIINEGGHNVSGGEKSEFTFLQKIKDARTKDILLIDEPESSFDNVFLKRDINRFIKEMANEMPVVVSTHNNTIGGSIKPDYILYTNKEHEDDGTEKFVLYSGHPTDKKLRSVEGKEIDNYQITISSLEAGEDAYNERNSIYEALKD